MTFSLRSQLSLLPKQALEAEPDAHTRDQLSDQSAAENRTLLGEPMLYTALRMPSQDRAALK